MDILILVSIWGAMLLLPPNALGAISNGHPRLFLRPPTPPT